MWTLSADAGLELSVITLAYCGPMPMNAIHWIGSQGSGCLPIRIVLQIPTHKNRFQDTVVTQRLRLLKSFSDPRGLIELTSQNHVRNLYWYTGICKGSRHSNARESIADVH